MESRVQTWPVQRRGGFERCGESPAREPQATMEDTYQLLPGGNQKTTNSTPLPKPSRWDAVFRSFGLSIIYTKFKGIDTEYRKVAIWKSWGVAVPKLLLHFIPVGAAIVLIWLNLSGYYLGVEVPGIQGHNSAKLGALQFAAKMHEITILASLSMIVFHVVQSRIVKNDVAFATLFAGLQYRDLSYFWSKELWQIIDVEKRRWMSFLPVLIMAMILVPTVGPSSALLMIPRSDEHAVGGIDYWLNTTRGELWPSDVTPDVFGVDPSCSQDPDLLNCPSSGWDSLTSHALTSFRNLALPGSPYNYINGPNSAPIPGKYGFRSVRLRKGDNWTLATTPTRILADSLAVTSMFWDDASGCPPRREHFSWRESARWITTGLRQAMTRASCFVSPNGEILFPSIDPLGDFGDLEASFTSGLFNLTDPYWLNRVKEMSSSNRSELIWLKLNHTQLGKHSLGAIATIPSSREDYNITIGCEIDPQWVDAEYTIKQTQVGGVGGATWVAEPQTYVDAHKYHPAPSRINISSDWAEYLNPRISSTGQTAFEHMVFSAGQLDPENLAVLTDFTEKALSGMVSNGLSNLNPLVALQGERPVGRTCVPAWYDPFMPQRSSRGLGAFGKGGTFWNMTGIDTTDMTKFKMEAFVTGYAYSSNGTTSTAAVVVLLIYCLMAVLHTAYVFVTGHSSSSWESIPDIVALAIRSRPTNFLSNTGAGISTKDVFRHPIQIRDADGRIQITFSDTKNGTVSIEENKKYG